MYVRMYAFVVGDNIRRDVGKAIKYLQLASHGGKSCDMHEGHVTVTPFPCMYVHVRTLLQTTSMHFTCSGSSTQRAMGLRGAATLE